MHADQAIHVIKQLTRIADSLEILVEATVEMVDSEDE